MIPSRRAIVAVLFLILPIAGHAADKLRLGKAQGTAWTFIPADIAVDQGLFAKYGIEVEIVDLTGDAKVQQALTAGSIDFGLGSGPGMAFAAKGSSAIAVAAFAGAPHNISAIVLENSPITTVAGLRGKRLSVSTVGSLTEWLAKQMALQEGWGSDGVQTVALGGIDSAISALRAHEVDAVVLGTEAGYKLEEAHQGRIITDMARYAPHFITHVVFAQKAMVATNPALVERFLKGFFAAIAFVKANKEATSRVAERVLHQSEAVAGRTYDSEMPMFETDGIFDPQAIETLKRSFVEMGTLDKAPANDALFTTQFLPVKF